MAIVKSVPRQCQRPDCFEPASVAYSFDASRQLVLLDALDDEDRVGSVLCGRHAHAMVLPKGWWLDDRRVSTPALFTTGRAATIDAMSSATVRPRRRRHAAPSMMEPPALPIEHAETEASPAASDQSELPPVPLSGAEEPTEPESVVGVEAVPAWLPNFDSVDDMTLLQADSPLLSRAFGAKGSQGARRRRAK